MDAQRCDIEHGRQRHRHRHADGGIGARMEMEFAVAVPIAIGSVVARGSGIVMVRVTVTVRDAIAMVVMMLMSRGVLLVGNGSGMHMQAAWSRDEQERGKQGERTTRFTHDRHRHAAECLVWPRESMRRQAVLRTLPSDCHVHGRDGVAARSAPRRVDLEPSQWCR
ncbi:MAG: hypothetical protein H0X45_12250 [Planctomycetes bacterium]|nr:hypothetical protein [Planctomycetota bacterium]